MTINLPESVTTSLQFLVVEIVKQLDVFRSFLAKPDKGLAKKLLARSGYSHNLERRIEHSSTDILTMEPGGVDTESIRAVEKIAYNLQDISDHACKCTRQLVEFNSLESLPAFDWLDESIETIQKQIKLIPKLLRRKNPDAVLKCCDKHSDLLHLFTEERERQIQHLHKTKNPREHIDTLFVAYEIQRIAEHLHFAYEAAVSGIVGHPVSIEQLSTIKKGLKKVDKKKNLADINIESLALTKSGSTVSALVDNRPKRKKRTRSIAVFKDGDKRKLIEELDSLEAWQYIYKGLVPQIYHFRKFDNRASMMVEHLDGCTFEALLLQDDNQLRRRANKKLAQTLAVIYESTQSFERKPSGFMQQLLERLDAVLKVHPEFDSKQFRQKIQNAAEFERKRLRQTPTVFIHGDFNIDNILYNQHEHCVHFIDLRRSTYQDYVQDISVFLVSNYRLNNMQAEVRKRIMEQIKFFVKVARGYANQIEDKTFEVRLALGLARSLLTSTRFIIDKKRSEYMLQQSQKLLDEVLELKSKTIEQYRVKISSIFDS